MATFIYVDRARAAFVHRTHTNGPRGGKHKVWEARSDGNFLCQRRLKTDAIAALRKYLETGERPGYDTI